MKAFRTSAHTDRVIADKFRRQETVAYSANRAVETLFHRAAQEVIDNALATGVFHAPDLQGLDTIMLAFYQKVIEEGWTMARQERHLLSANKRLAKLPEGKIPPLKDLIALFGNKKVWERVQKRSKYIADRLRKAYMRKLRTRFTQISADLMEGVASPKQVHDKLMDGWNASRARVGTIFRTETTKYFAETQVAYFSGDPDIIGFLFDSVRDMSRTSICHSRHGMVFRPGTKALAENTPPCHWSCRSHLIPLANTQYNRKLLEDPSRDPSKISLVPLPAGWHSGKSK